MLYNGLETLFLYLHSYAKYHGYGRRVMWTGDSGQMQINTVESSESSYGERYSPSRYEAQPGSWNFRMRESLFRDRRWEYGSLTIDAGTGMEPLTMCRINNAPNSWRSGRLF